MFLGHSAHTEALDAPRALEYEPGAQALQEAEPLRPVYFPALQGAHDAEDTATTAPELFPTGHSVHAVMLAVALLSTCENEPAPHARHPASVPGGQQDFAAAALKLAGQPAHLVAQ